MFKRSILLIIGVALLWLPSGCGHLPGWTDQIIVNDIHSQLNPTRVDRVVMPKSLLELQAIIRDAGEKETPISIAGGRHAMGGQQFGTDTILVDMSGLNRVLNFDSKHGLIEVEAGIQWPELIAYLLRVQKGKLNQWGIIQKQTGGDRFSIGGSLSANAHGRGLKLKPLIADVESFVLIDAEGALRTCNRSENVECFRLVAGGYGLFGVIYSVNLRLQPRMKLERVVEVINVEELMPAFEKRISNGFLYGDFQFSIDEKSDDFLRKGVFSSYRPVNQDLPMPDKQKELNEDDWRELFLLSHNDKEAAFKRYSSYYLSTSGQLYWSDSHQLSVYIDDYHKWLDRKLGASEKATEMITEVYVPRQKISSFLNDIRKDFRENSVHLIYGTIRLIEKDDESFLAWAKKPYVAVVMNLHTVHTPEGLEKSAEDFRRLIDRAISYGGSFFLTYHRWARRDQIEICYPQFADFLKLKQKYDPKEVFQSNWYRHYKRMFQDALAS
jgi:FAD/FMN-containing dehydrogenase